MHCGPTKDNTREENEKAKKTKTMNKTNQHKKKTNNAKPKKQTTIIKNHQISIGMSVQSVGGLQVRLARVSIMLVQGISKWACQGP